jgi:hypothetical protein
MKNKKINIFEIYNKVHGSNLETPKLKKQSYCPIATKRKEAKIVNGKFSLSESLESDDKTLSGDLKRHFLEIISTYKGFQGQMQRPSDIVEIAETLCGIVDAAKTLTLNEAGDWFDKVTIKRNMTELERLDKSFDKVAKDAKALDERLHALYEDMGNILGRYYEISDIDPAVMKGRLGLKED